MITREAGIAARIRKIFGDKAQVIVGPRTPSSAAWVRPEIYVQLAWFDDWGEETREGARTARRPLSGETAGGTAGETDGYVEERPGRVVLDLEVCSSEYSHVQGIRETLVAPILSHLETLEELNVSVGDGGRTRIVFRDFHPVLDHLSIALHPDDDGVFYSGKIRFNFDGFMHVRVVSEGSVDRRTSVRKKAKVAKKGKSRIRKKKI